VLKVLKANKGTGRKGGQYVWWHMGHPTWAQDRVH